MGNNRKPNQSSNRNAKGNLRYHQGYYEVINLNKYIGNPAKVIYRSKWELHFMKFCDNNTSIVRWSSEFITIPYQDEKGHYHRYYPDFYAEIIDKQDPMRFDKVVIEIKPYKETQQPTMPEKITPKALESLEYQLKTYQKNLMKWTRAINWCEKNGMKFVIIHEGHLKQKNIM